MSYKSEFSISRWVLTFAAALLALIIAVLAGLQLRPSLEGYVRAQSGEEADLKVVFHGTSTLSFVRDGEAVVVDGFVTRPSLWALFRPLKPDAEKIRTTFAADGIERIAAVLVGHSHYDHVMDAATTARLFDGEVWGTAATANIAKLEGYDRARIVVAGRPVSTGGFTITPFDLPHAPGGRMMQPYDPRFSLPAKVGDYRFGGGLGYALHTGACRMLVVPSAGIPAQALSAYRADIVFLSIGQLGLQSPEYIRRYWQTTVVATGAKWVVPIHWDDFTRPLEDGLIPLPYAVERIDKAMDAILELAGEDVTVVMPLDSQPMDLAPLNHCS